MAENETKTKPTMAEEAKTLGVKTSKVMSKRFTGKDLEKEEARNAKLVADRTANRIKKAKAAANMTPIKKRRAMIEAKIKGEKAAPQRRWSDRVLRTYVEELQIIKSSPKVWKERTQNGKIPYPNTPAKKKTAMQLATEAMDLD